MKKNQVVIPENYLERIPARPESMKWSTGDDGIVTLEIENKGVFNRIAQKLFRRPRISYIHLDETGSFLWPILDGEKSITDLGVLVDEKFGEASHPLYERLATYFKILDSYGFINWIK
ncbi:MAG: PqqD family protein [Clostridia bacterium]|nr:PqqD family protein [Clostridia bacterium]